MSIDTSETPAKPLILFVEDEFFIREVVAEALEEGGFNVLTADNGPQGAKVFAENRISIRGLVTDINLGEGIDGWDLARAARKHTGDLPVIYVSGASCHQWASQGVPNSRLIEKPFVPAQIIEALSSLLLASGAELAPKLP